jgi:FkbM family methyltransferase
VAVFDEVFGRSHVYDFPPHLRAILDRCGRPLRVLDLGGNVGLFAVHALGSLRDVIVTSFEPDPFNLPLIERCIELNQADDRWTVIAACAATRDGTVPFVAGNYADSRVAVEGEPTTLEIPSLDIFPLMHRFDLVKMDIEGSEWPILLDPRFADVTPAVFVVEWHTYGCPERDPRLAVDAAFKGAGYRTQLSPPTRDTHGNLWAWRVE